MSSIEKEFADVLAVLTDGDSSYKLMCAFSGGCDSLALLILAVRTLGKNRVVPLYVNHNLRDKNELEREIRLNSENCRKLGLSLQVDVVQADKISGKIADLGVEAAARSARYEVLAKNAAKFGCKFIATAHHFDDQLETVLMKIIGNAPVPSMRGISEKLRINQSGTVFHKSDFLNSDSDVASGVLASFNTIATSDEVASSVSALLAVPGMMGTDDTMGAINTAGTVAVQADLFVIRPLLEFRKSCLKKYVEICGFVWSCDSTNANNSFKRNELRNLIIPQLKSVMPDWERRVDNLRRRAIVLCGRDIPVDFFASGSAHLSKKEQNKEASKNLSMQCAGSKNLQNSTCSVNVDFLKTFNDEQKLMVLYSMWDKTLGTMMPQTLARRVLSKLNDSFVVEASNGGTFCIYRSVLYLVSDAQNKIYEKFEKEIDFNERVVELLGNIVLEISDEGNDNDLWLDKANFAGKVVVRYAKLGDAICLKDGKKTVFKLLQDMKIPPILRVRVPVIVDETGICAVFGSVFGGRDRLCANFRTSIARLGLSSYICRQY